VKRRYLELWKLGKTYGGQAVVRDVDLCVHEGELVCLVGHSGCGKSTVLAMAAGLVEPTTGQVAVAGREVRGAGTDRGVVFQSPALLPWMTALENVLLAVERVHSAATRAERREIARTHLLRVGLADAHDRRPAELSAGMRQRVGIARALALSPKVLLLDEPFGMLDSLTRLELQDLLLEVWARERTTALMVTHDVDEALFLSDRVALMTSGPAARIGEVLDVPFRRPRVRDEIMEAAEYDALRERLLTFLEDESPEGRDRPERTSAA